MRRSTVLLSLIGLAIIGIGGYGYYHNQRWSPLNLAAAGPDGISGTLTISVFGKSRPHSEVKLHHIVFVNNSRYTPLEDNDIRGFLDGHVTHRWNQPTQVHVRLGRRDDNPAYGEYELFRVLQKWSDIKLPPGSQITEAKLSCIIELGCKSPLHVYLYAINRDWNAGVGGLQRDNLSSPQTGDVWWIEAAHDQDDWGLPGANYASNDAAADTAVMPLAVANYQPGDELLLFSSAALTDYAQRMIASGKPLDFLMKMSDFEEDLPGAKLIVFSGEADDDRNVTRRPSLEITWLNASESKRKETPLMLEYGRTITLPRILLSDADRWLNASFEAEKSSPSPTIEVRGGQGEESSSWHILNQPIPTNNWDWLEVRVIAATDPIPLGSLFTASMHNTWVTTGPPDEQIVRWTFISPTQREHHLQAKYMDDFAWSMEFLPGEIGRWQYRWSHHFNDEPFDSSVGVFDVIAGTRENIIHQLELLLEEVKSSQALIAVSRTKQFAVRFARLERAAINCETPASFRSESGQSMRSLLDDIRKALSGTSKLD